MDEKEKVLILTNEPIWFQLAPQSDFIVLSPELWDIQFKNGSIYCKNEEESLSYKIKSILLREGHVYPSEKYKKLILKIKDSNIHCINDPDVTLACLDSVSIFKKIKDNIVLSKYCVTQLINPIDITDQSYPFVLKLPDFHGGFGKWLIKNSTDLNELLGKQIKLNFGETNFTGYLHKEPFIAKNLFVEPFLKGKDIRIWVIKDRKKNEYLYQGLERKVKEGQWLANRYTESFIHFKEMRKEFIEICQEASKILNNPDIFAVDLMLNGEKIYLLEIHNDVPGLTSLENEKDYTIHKILLTNSNSFNN